MLRLLGGGLLIRPRSFSPSRIFFAAREGVSDHPSL